MNHWRFGALVPLLLVLAIAATPAAAPANDKPAKDKKEAKPEDEPFGRLTVDQVESRLGRPDVHIYDGNSAEVYAQNHVPGAIRIYHDDVKAGASALPADKDATLIFYCANLL